MELSGKSEILVRKMNYLRKKNGFVGIHIYNNTKYALHTGTTGDIEDFVSNVDISIIKELKEKNIIKTKVVKIIGERVYHAYYLTDEYVKELNDRLKLTKKQVEVLNEYHNVLSKYNKNNLYIRVRKFGNGNSDYVYNYCIISNDLNDGKYLGDAYKGISKRTVNTLMKKGILWNITNKGRLVNEIEATDLIYSKDKSEFIIGIKELDEKGDII